MPRLMMTRDALLVALVLAVVGTMATWTVRVMAGASQPDWPMLGAALAALGALALYLLARPSGPRDRPAPRSGLEPLFQDDYAALLRTEGDRTRAAFVTDPRTGAWFCRRCSRRAEDVIVSHPVWDGPFEGAGSGVVDERVIPWCLRCDRDDLPTGADPRAPVGPWSSRPVRLPGRPVRLAWLDTLPVSLLPELYQRPAFHRLPIKVEPYAPPVGGARRQEPPPILGPRPHAFIRDARGPWCAACGLPAEHDLHAD